jgi:electron transport complex protein RnfD
MKPLLSAPFKTASDGHGVIMDKVMLALTPATAIGLFIFGWPALFLFSITLVSAFGWEALCLRVAGKPVRATLADHSALLTGWLVALSLPPWAPWWIGVLGGFIAIVVGKQVYGGLGQNLFNPAMLARVALLVSFPLEMTAWPIPGTPIGSSLPGLGESWGIFLGQPIADGYTGATSIGYLKTELSRGKLLPAIADEWDYSLWADLAGFLRGGSLGETSAIALLLGGLWLLREQVITWEVPSSLLLTVALLAGAAGILDPMHQPGLWFHLSSGGVVLLAFFIATDYVTSPNSRMGQIVFGAGCGALVFIIRSWGAYPEGVAFAVLLMNSLTPLIDHYIQPRIYGRDFKGHPLELEGKP